MFIDLNIFIIRSVYSEPPKITTSLAILNKHKEIKPIK